MKRVTFRQFYRWALLVTLIPLNSCSTRSTATPVLVQSCVLEVPSPAGTNIVRILRTRFRSSERTLSWFVTTAELVDTRTGAKKRLVDDAQVPGSWRVPSRTDDRPWHTGYHLSLVSWSPTGGALWLGEFLADENFAGVLVVGLSTGRVTYLNKWPTTAAWSEEGYRLLTVSTAAGTHMERSGLYVVDSEAGTVVRFDTGLDEIWDARWIGRNRVRFLGFRAPESTPREYEMDLDSTTLAEPNFLKSPARGSFDRVVKWIQSDESEAASSCGETEIGM